MTAEEYVNNVNEFVRMNSEWLRTSTHAMLVGDVVALGKNNTVDVGGEAIDDCVQSLMMHTNQ